MVQKKSLQNREQKNISTQKNKRDWKKPFYT